jgi:hypothetical protein
MLHPRLFAASVEILDTHRCGITPYSVSISRKSIDRRLIAGISDLARSGNSS